MAASIKGAFQQLGVFTGSAVEGVGVPGSPGILNPELTDAPLKVVKVAGNSEKSPGGTGFGIDVDELRHQLETALGDEIRQHEIQMRVTPEGLVVSLREVGFFNSGQAELLKNGYKTLTRIATILGGRGFEIRVEGHTDNGSGSQLPFQIELGAINRARDYGCVPANRAARIRSDAGFGRGLF